MSTQGTMKVGDKIETWFSGRGDGLSTILEIKPYTGRYPEHFNCVLVLTAPGNFSGKTEMAWKQEEDSK